MCSGLATKTAVRARFFVLLVTAILFFCTISFSQTLGVASAADDLEALAKNTAGRWLLQRFKCFENRHDHNSYFITLCGDVPDNSRPTKVYYRKEPGHVFLVLTMRDTVCTGPSKSLVFGFYPQRPVSSVLFKNVRCEMNDNSNRVYDVQIEKLLSSEEFDVVLENSIVFAQKKYNLNRYNCYDYALDVFNSLPFIEKLPVNKIRFPFIAGKGGSPVCLFRDLKKLKEEGSSWAPYIGFGAYKAPVSYKN